MKKTRYQKYMLRPLIYMAAQRLMVAVIFLLILVRFVKNGPAPSMVAGFLTMVFALFSFLIYLRMDGLRIPRMKHIKKKKTSDPLQSFGSFSDHVDDEPQVTFDDLEEEEKDLCSFLSNVINLVIFFVLSFIL